MSDSLPTYLVERLLEAFASDARVGELGLEVVVTGEVLHVYGKVGTVERRDAISEVALEHSNGLEIRNEVRVLDAGGHPHDPERLE